MLFRIPLSLCFLVSIAAYSCLQAVPVIPMAGSPVQIDGQVDVQWGLANPLPLQHAIVLYDMLDPQDVEPDPVDLSAKARFLWDEQHLYLLAMIVDDNPQAPYTGTWFREDTVELYLDLDLSGESNNGQYDGVNDWEIGFHSMADPVGIVLGPNSVQNDEGFLAASTLTGNGYFIEAALPWDTLGIAAPSAGDRIALDVHVVDNDNQSGSREHKLAWASTVDEAWQDTRSLGELILAEAPAILSDPIPDPLPSNGIGIALKPFAKVPNSPATGNAPRLNMVKEAPDGSGRLFAIDQLGYLYQIDTSGQVALYMNIRQTLGNRYLYDNTQTGSTSFAFHPEFAKNGKLYLVTSSPTWTGTADFLAKRPIDPSVKGADARNPLMHDILVEFTADDPSTGAFSGTFREVIRIEQPYLDHNVGEVAFNPAAAPGDPDYGMLYMAVADGGNKYPIDDADPEDNAQNLSTLHGTIIRIDPLGTNSANGKYGIPADNPYALAGPGILPEIWSHGHRNNHRLSWDLRSDNALYSFEMGQEMVEEVNRIVPGGNFGWGNREGTLVLNEYNPLQVAPIPSVEIPDTYQYPVFQYDHPDNSGAIAGGAVYRGRAMPSLYGKLITADFTGNRGAYYGQVENTRGLAHGTAAPLHELDIYDSKGNLSDLSTALLGSSGTRRTDLRIHMDLGGELYFTNKRNGWIHKLEPAPTEHGVPWPNTFPNAGEVSPGNLRTDSLGFVYFPEWPWVYSYSIGWVWIQDPGSPDAPGNWIYRPKPR
ncbi:MAG: sugar-binding protein [Oceanipulchritudo sp.]